MIGNDPCSAEVNPALQLAPPATTVPPPGQRSRRASARKLRIDSESDSIYLSRIFRPEQSRTWLGAAVRRLPSEKMTARGTAGAVLSKDTSE